MQIINIGLLFSETGTYDTMGHSMVSGTLLAIDEINNNPEYKLKFIVHKIDPEGKNAKYREAASTLLAQENITHIIGCYTSSSRKEVLPIFEKYDGLLWYPTHYEGFETSDSVIYTGAAPNQHIIPLTEYALKHHGKNAWFVGSNYIWAWENNRIMRETLIASGGDVLGERYLSVGDTDMLDIIEQILIDKPNFVFVNLIGESAYAFLRQFRQLANERGIDQAKLMPCMSCSLSEPELMTIGSDFCEGHISSSVYFENIDTPENHNFVKRFKTNFPDAGPACANAEASYNAVYLLARAIQIAGSADVGAVRNALPQIKLNAPQGEIQIDGNNYHAILKPRIGLSNKQAGFDVIFEAADPISPDPYLTWFSPGVATISNSNLRVVG